MPGWSYSKIAAILPFKRSWQGTASYKVTVVYMYIKGGSDHPLPLSQPSTIRPSTPLLVREENTEEETRS
jgi:hypothetical protein